jgi:transcriptional regulator with PAS, ATPase and Fis domain
MKRTKQTPNKENKTLQTIINTHPDGVTVTGKEGRLLLTNQITNKISGIGPIDIIPTDRAALAESKSAEIELKKSEERLKAIFKGFPILLPLAIRRR